tara:strand:+ start:2910 stop:3920 length:1011 start_codon:yes stop_codon:yes gene_type:complete
MKKLKINIFILLLSAYFQSYSQDIVFSQNFIVPESLSSSFTGASRTTKLGSIFRSQWRNSGVKTHSNFAFADTWFDRYNTGIGISLLNQKEDGSSYTFNQLNINFAMAFQINDSWFFRPSVSMGLGIKNYGFQNLRFGDDFNQANFNFLPTSSENLSLFSSKRSFFDYSSSILFNNQDSWIGMTFRHLNKPNISLTENRNVPLDIFFSLHAKYYIPLFQNYRTWITSKSKVFVLSNFIKQGPFNRLDLGAQYVYDETLSFGMTLRANPNKSTTTASLINGYTTFVGLRWQGYKFGYSYDVNTLSILNSGGVHEFSVSYDFYVNIGAINRFKCVRLF